MCPCCTKTYKSTAGCRAHMKKHQTKIIQQLHDDINAGIIVVQTDDNSEQQNASIAEVTMDNHQQSMPTIVYDNNPLNENDLNIASTGHILEDNVVIVTDTVLNIANGLQDDGTDEQLYLLFSDYNDGHNGDNLQYILVDETIAQQLPASIHEPIDKRVAATTVDPPPLMALDLPEPSKICAVDNYQSKSDRYQCASCPKSFKKPIDLRRHTRTHTGERPYQCDKCSKSFSLLCTLKAHLRTHATVKETVQCPVCWRSFATASSLRTHTQLHTDQPKPFKCDYCNMKFRSNGHRKNHQQVHERQAKKLNVDVRETKTKKQMSKLQPLLDMMNGLYGEGAENIVTHRDSV